MAKGRVPATTRHVHYWSYNDALFFSEDEQTVFLTRYCATCGTREVGDVAFRKPDGDEFRLILREEAKRDANPRAELDVAYGRGFSECLMQVFRALDKFPRAPQEEL